MRRFLTVAVPAALALAGAAGPASATQCAGTASTAYVCVDENWLAVDPTGNTISDCVYAGPPPCTEVSVDYPSVQRGPGCPVWWSIAFMSDPFAISCS